MEIQSECKKSSDSAVGFILQSLHVCQVSSVKIKETQRGNEGKMTTEKKGKWNKNIYYSFDAGFTETWSFSLHLMLNIHQK